MLRRLLREQLQRVEQGLDPINVMRDPSTNKRISTGAWNTILSPTEAAALLTARTSKRPAAGAALPIRHLGGTGALHWQNIYDSGRLATRNPPTSRRQVSNSSVHGIIGEQKCQYPDGILSRAGVLGE
jgi:hypothetical protein